MRALDSSRTPSQWLIAAGVEASEVAQILRSFRGIPQVFSQPCNIAKTLMNARFPVR